MLPDISTLDDIKLLVDSFYEEVRRQPLIGPIFNKVIQDKWPEHLAKMYTFWQTVLLEEHTYFGSPFPPHAKLPVNKAHFDEWLSTWYATLDRLFDGPKAEEAKWRGSKMAAMFLSKITYYQSNSFTPLY